MSRMQPLTKENAPEETREILAAAEERFGEPSIPSGIQARCPAILAAGRELGAAPARSGTLSQELRSLVCVRAAQIVTCPF